MGAMLLAFGMAEPERRGYGEGDSYFGQPRRLPDTAARAALPGADRQQAEAAACGRGYRASRCG